MFSSTIYSQNDYQYYASGSQSFNHLFTTTNTTLNLGVKLIFKKTSLTPCFSYMYSGVVNFTGHQDYGQKFKAFELNSHQLGFGLKYEFLPVKSFYHPYLMINIDTEIFSSYRGKGLISTYEEKGTQVNFSPSDIVRKKGHYAGGSHGMGKYVTDYYFTNNYISTPLVGSFIIGNEFRLFENFYIEIQLGYMFRAFRYFYNQWLPGESAPPVNVVDTHRLKDTPHGTTVYEHYFEMGLGLNYSFSFKSKKEK
ncbi:MAG: hypothetical protein M9897_09485 [Brumimicrobium sp.]|nr:hypothetical protein [Brumimicrobium sp.]